MWWCDEIVDELDSQSVSVEHLEKMASTERSILLRSTPNEVLLASNPTHRRQVLGFLLNAFVFCPISPDFGRLATTSGVQVVASTAALYKCTKMHGTLLERVDGRFREDLIEVPLKWMSSLEQQLHVQMSEAFLDRAMARIAWLCALILVWQMAVVSGAVGAVPLISGLCTLQSCAERPTLPGSPRLMHSVEPWSRACV